MANHKSAKKRARQTPKRTARNVSAKKAIRTIEKKLRAAVVAKDKTVAAEMLVTYTSKTAKAAQKGILKAETASRKIGRLASQVSSI